MEHITIDQLKEITAEGLVLQGCGGDPQEWIAGINEMFTEEGLLLDGDKFRDISVFEHGGLTNMLFSMEGVKLNLGRLAMWRIGTRDTFGGTWLSDYLPNKLGVEMRSPVEVEKTSVLGQLAEAKERAAEKAPVRDEKKKTRDTHSL